MKESFDLRIDSIAAGGDGVGRRDGMVVFVPRTAPGDFATVEAELDGRMMRGRVRALRTRSEARVEPRCPHYVADSCGGCQIQHLDYEAQLTAKSGIIYDALTRIGRLKIGAPVVEPSPLQWRYRRKLTLAVRRNGDRVIVGMHRIDDPDVLFAVKDCEITDEKVMTAWRMVMARLHLLPQVPELRVALRLMPEGFSLAVEGGTRWDNYNEIIQDIPELVELWWKAEGARGHRHIHTDRSAKAGASFTQVNAAVAEQLVKYVAGIAAERPHATAIDAYAGTGDIAVALAALGAEVTAIEIDRDAHALCRSRLPDTAHTLRAPVERALAEALPAELVVVNPPRAGLAPIVADALQYASTQHSAPRTLIYVSCNPATLARDLKRMDRYRLISVRGFDMFPQTAHVETVCVLEPAA